MKYYTDPFVLAMNRDEDTIHLRLDEAKEMEELLLHVSGALPGHSADLDFTEQDHNQHDQWW